MENTTIRLWFEESEFGFSADCNSHSGAYSLCGDSLCTQGLGSTEMGCSADLQAQDEWLASFFTASPKIELVGDQLTLSTSEATLVFLDREVADPDRPLTGRTWTIDTFIDGDAASNLPLQVPPTVEFADDGTFQAFTTCNTGTGAYVAEGTSLTLSEVAYSEEGCDASGSDTADVHVKSVLTDGVVTTEIEAARLTLMHGTLGISATTD